MTLARPPRLPGGGDPGTNEALALEGTGPYWEVASVAGYFKCSGWAQTPAPGSLHLAGGSDTAYMLLGCRNLRTGKCCDAGIFLTSAGQVWDLAVFPNDPAKPGHGWLDRPIHRPAGSALYLVLETLRNALRLTAIDPATWLTVGTLEQTFDSAWGLNAADPSISLYRVTSLAQQPENLNSGSWFEAARWDKVYVYRKTGYGLWTAGRTSRTVKYPAQGPAVSVAIPDGGHYFAERVDIHLDR